MIFLLDVSSHKKSVSGLSPETDFFIAYFFSDQISVLFASETFFYKNYNCYDCCQKNNHEWKSVMQCMTYFFCTSLQFCTPFRSAQKLYQHPIDIHFFIRFSLTVAKIIILCFYLFPRKCFMFFFQIRNDICDSLSSKRTCHKYLLTASES